MSLMLIHLSDIHIKGASDPILKKADAIANSLNGYVPKASHIVIVISGDVAFSGSKSEYALAKSFLGALRNRIRKESRCEVDFLVCPGNHDCNFQANNESRNNNIAALQQTGAVDDSVIKSCTRIQEEFFKFRESLESWKSPSGDRLWRTVSIEIKNKKIIFDALNVAWVSKIKEDKNLHFPVDRYRDSVSSQSSDVRIIVFHHPLNWFNQAGYRDFRKFLRETGSILISGHEHEGNVGSIDETESGKSVYVEGCVLQEGLDLRGTGFFLLELDLDSMNLSHLRFEYAGDSYRPLTPPKVWDLPSVRTGRLEPSADFRRKLQDAGAISHPDTTSPLTLQDIFVYPDLRKVNERGKTSEFINSKALRQPAETRKGVILKCDERTGSSSLLYQLFLSYLDQGFAPLLIRGSNIQRATSKHVDELIDSTIREQYDEHDRVLVSQKSRKEKILLVDDIDESKVVDAQGRAEVLSHLKKIADHVVIVISGNYGLEELLEENNSADLVEFERYDIQPFGYSRRSELVKRWISIGGKNIGDAELISECDKAERLIAVAMRKSLIPSVPLYLLTLLQSVSAGKSADLKESSLGHYYSFLLYEALLNAGVPKSRLGEHFQYATNLAWEFKNGPSQRIDRAGLRKFNRRFADDYFSVDLDKEIDILLRARVLVAFGDEYEFRYPYIFYHLRGRYLSANIDDEDIKAYIAHCCSHLYVRDYANTILFLAHHATSRWLLDSISAAMSKLFDNFKEISFDGDTREVDNLISDAPALVYKGGSPVQHREEKNKELDKIDEEEGDNDGLMETEENSEQRSLGSQVVMLFKTTEILGQILKNQYSTIRRPHKVQLIESLFDGSLRTLRCFYQDMLESADKLVARVKKAIEDSGSSMDVQKREKLARRFLAEMVESISVGILSHAAASVNAEALVDDISDVVEKKRSLEIGAPAKSNAYRLLALAVALDSAKDIPRAKLAELYQDKKSDLLASRIIKLLVLTRLYMFRTSESDMQWLASTLEISLTQQHKIAYSNSGRKLN
ncbi:metallophosphoesterase [Tahibacter soli]|uniref:Metallophosphoesterase n=1 Tax=Tahibacter soli TaxID=2983605 RepID=A0A9X4BL10_9GAMM|nr:metallophosphoesterase [Tahibacter soli]MDC8016273.1 metallophosphoesterase [Tahibacter soli]